MLTAIAILYFLGIFLHYTHVVVAVILSDDTPDLQKTMLVSLVWPLMTCWYFYTLVLARGDDEDE